MISDKWRALFNRVNAKGNPWLFFFSLVDNYDEEHRHYHNLKHVEECLKDFELARHLCKHPDEVELAIWYHDVIYDTKAKDNEEKSAEFAKTALSEMGLQVGNNISDLIFITKHLQRPKSVDEKIIVDIDLAILGKPEVLFQEYDKNIRKEYSWVPDNLFYATRIAVLQRFLDRKSIYSTEFFREKYEKQARKNLEMSINNNNLY